MQGVGELVRGPVETSKIVCPSRPIFRSEACEHTITVLDEAFVSAGLSDYFLRAPSKAAALFLRRIPWTD